VVRGKNKPSVAGPKKAENPLGRSKTSDRTEETNGSHSPEMLGSGKKNREICKITPLPGGRKYSQQDAPLKATRGSCAREIRESHHETFLQKNCTTPRGHRGRKKPKRASNMSGAELLKSADLFLGRRNKTPFQLTGLRPEGRKKIQKKRENAGNHWRTSVTGVIGPG